MCQKELAHVALFKVPSREILCNGKGKQIIGS